MNNIVLDFRHNYVRGERLESMEIVYQYDTGRVVEAYVPETEEGFVLNIGFENASVLSVISVDDVVADEEGGYKILATIPDSILTGYGNLLVYIVAGGGANVLATTYEGIVPVRYKPVAEGYIPPDDPATSIIERCEVAAAAAEAAMVDKLDNTFITGLDESASGDDTDLLAVGYRGASTLRKFSFANLATYIRDKLTSLTFSSLNTSSKTLPGAINELNTKTLTTSATCQQVDFGTVVTNSVLKKSGVALLTYSVTGVTTAGMQGTICTLPEGYRPPQQIMCNITGTYNGTAGVYTAVINTDGNVRTFTGSGTFTAIYCYGIVFPVA